jgi:hypothetical protein
LIKGANNNADALIAYHVPIFYQDRIDVASDWCDELIKGAQ